MFKNKSHIWYRRISQLSIFLLIWLLAACTSTASIDNQEITLTSSAAEIITETATSTASPTASDTPTLTPTSTQTPLPPTPEGTPIPLAQFSFNLRPEVKPLSYVESNCDYLANRWNSQKSEPGTVVVPIMFHSITKDGREINDAISIYESDFNQFMEYAHQKGFETITSDQLAAFLKDNERIPKYAMMLIVDDRKRSEYFLTHFQKYNQAYNWTVTNGWISNPETPNYLWEENEMLAGLGWIDYQSHGVVHNIPINGFSSEEFIRTELFGSIEGIQSHFNTIPIAYIWPGGGFTQQGIDIAEEAGYQFGFSVFSRGALLYNWIPQGPEELKVDNPLMVLPRYWSPSSNFAINHAIEISQNAEAFALDNWETEANWYAMYCVGYPPLEFPTHFTPQNQ